MAVPTINTRRTLAAASVVMLAALVAAPPAGAATAAPTAAVTVRLAGALAPSPSGLKGVTQSTSSIALSWNAVAGAPRYRIQLSTSANMKSPAYFESAVPSIEFKDLTAGKNYYARVRAITVHGGELTSYSKVITLKTAPAPVVVLKAPADLKAVHQSDTSIKAAWTAVAGAPRYRIQLSTSPSMKYPSYFESATPEVEFTGLKPGTRYYTKVRAITIYGGELSAYSRVLSMNTELTVPAGLAPTKQNVDSLELAWNAVNGASAYDVQLATAPDMSGASERRVKTASARITGLAPETTYYARVRTVGATGISPSQYSPTVAVTTAAKTYAVPTGVAAAEVTESSLKVGWTAVADAPQYVLAIADNAAMTGAELRSLKENSTAVTGLKAGTTYYFQVRVTKADGTPLSAYSAPVTAATKAAAALPVAAVDPADWVRWESIAKPGENINTVLAKPELSGKILKLPAGVFEVSNFRDASLAIKIPARVKGMIGEGRDTIIRIKANTSTYGNTVPAQSTGRTNQLYIIRMNDGTQPQMLSDFWLQGTEQGHLYNGIMIGNSKPGTTFKNVLITGVPGDAGTPPGETFGLNWWRGSDSITRDIEVDGFRWTGDTFAGRVKGALVGASPIGYNSHDRAKLYNAYTHDSNVGMPTFWKSHNGETWNLQSIRNVIGINHEESFGTVHHEPVVQDSKTRRHYTFMAKTGDGTLTIINPVNNEWISTTKSGPVGLGKRVLMLTPTNYNGTNTNTIKTAPKIVLGDGVTAVPYTWAH